MGTITDGVETTDRFGMKLDLTGQTPWDRGRVFDSLRTVEDQGVRGGFGPLATRPAASEANNMMLWWDGLRLSWCDGMREDPMWIDIDSTSYVNIMDYGAVPIPDPDYAPTAPTSTIGLVDYDPFGYWRTYDAARMVAEAHNDSMRTHRPLFIPPGDWAFFSGVPFSGGDVPLGAVSGATSGRPTAPAAGLSLPKRSRVLGIFPHTRIWCFPTCTGNNSVGNPVELAGMGITTKVFDITDAYGVLESAAVEGFVFVGPTRWASLDTLPDTTVMEVVGFETNATITIKDIDINNRINPLSAGIDLSVGSLAVTNKEYHTVDNVNIEGPGINYNSRPGTFGIFYNQGRTRGINCSLPNAIIRNVKVNGYQVPISRHAGLGAENLFVHGLKCKGSAYADIFVQGNDLLSAGRVAVTGYTSIDSARSFEAEQCDLTIEGEFKCTYTGFPTDSAYGQVDFGRIIQGCRLKLQNYEVSGSGGAIRTIGVNQFNNRVDISLLDTVIDAPVASLVRSTGGTNITVSAWNHTQNDGLGVFVAREIRIPVPLADRVAVTTNAHGLTLSEATDLAGTRAILGWLLQVLGVST